MSNKDYFKELGRKIEKKVPTEIDNTILGEIRTRNEKSLVSSMIPMAVAIAIGFFSFFTFTYKDNKQVQAIGEFQTILEEPDFIENLEYLTEVEDDVDVTDLSDEEWDILLEEKDV